MKFTDAIGPVIGLATVNFLLAQGAEFTWGTDKVRGANLGGWLVLEPWISPLIFENFPGDEVVDEYTLCKFHPDTAKTTLQNHWESWVGLSDFQTIASYGFNTVRIPIGYWAFMTFDSPYISGAQTYLDRAIGWANQTGLKVWIDLHGAPGSQNGFDNSGHNGSVSWGDGYTVADTLAVIQLIANKYAQPSYQRVVTAIEVMNEPLIYEVGGGPATLFQYYKDAYGDVRVIGETPVILHDAFQNGTYWDGTLAEPGQGVIIDHHEYQIFTEDLINQKADDRVPTICANAAAYSAKTDHWTVIGEWTGAMTDCAKYLNGYKRGSRWEGTYPVGSTPTGRSCGDIDDIRTWNQTLKDATSRYIKAQIDEYELKTQGWVFWNFKTQMSAEWDLERLLKAGLFPNVTKYQASPAC